MEITRDTLDTREKASLDITVAGRTYAAWEMTARQRKEGDGFNEGPTVWDPTGRPTQRALFTKVSTPRSGSIGVACHADANAYERGRCVAAMEAIAQADLPGGPVTSTALVVGGVRLDPKRARCWANEPRAVYCERSGYVRWQTGDGVMARAWIDERIRGAGLGPKYGAWRVDRDDAACIVGEVSRSCVRLDYFGALDHPAEQKYIALVEDGATANATAIECELRAGDPASPLCRQVFASLR